MTNYIKNTCIILLLTGLFFGCNKTKIRSNRMDGHKWKITTITVNGSGQNNLPDLLFKECDIYEESCEGSWITGADGRAKFVWQFRDKGKTLEIANQTDHVHSYEDVKAAEQCIEFSGVYEVEKSKRKKLILKSSSTAGHGGQEVKIEMERKD